MWQNQMLHMKKQKKKTIDKGIRWRSPEIFAETHQINLEDTPVTSSNSFKVYLVLEDVMCCT